MGSHGILTVCPSAAAFAIALGPTYPWMIVIAKEPLGLRRSRLSLDLRLLVPTFSLPYAPVPLTGRPSPRMECSPTTVCLNFRGDRDASAVTRSLRAPPFSIPNCISDDRRDE